MGKSIFERLFKMHVILLISVFVVVSVTVSVFLNQYVIREQKTRVMSAVRSLEYWTATLQIEEHDERAERAYRHSLESWSELLEADIMVSNLDGEVVSSTANITSVPEEYLAEIANGTPVVHRGSFGGSFKNRQLTIGVPVRYNGTIIAAMFFNVPLKHMTDTTRDIIMMFVLCAMASIIISFIFVYIQARRISRPIGEINKAAQNIAAGNFSDRVRVTSEDEIGQLASSFNYMADSIENLETMSAGFISDVSHELRTPMTSISGFAQSILDGTIPEEKRGEYLKIIVDESRRLNKLVNDMLTMSKMSSSEYQLTIEKFDINELIRICIISMENQITERGLDLNVEFFSESLPVLGDKDSIKRVVLNLIDNAVKFSYENTTITINTWSKNKKAYISVGNFGDGIDRKDLSNIFNRFYKTDKSRQRERSGAGLGLSLCKNIMSLHKQSIWVESNPAKEGAPAQFTKFTFTLEMA